MFSFENRNLERCIRPFATQPSPGMNEGTSRTEQAALASQGHWALRGTAMVLPGPARCISHPQNIVLNLTEFHKILVPSMIATSVHLLKYWNLKSFGRTCFDHCPILQLACVGFSSWTQCSHPRNKAPAGNLSIHSVRCPGFSVENKTQRKMTWPRSHRKLAAKAVQVLSQLLNCLVGPSALPETCSSFQRDGLPPQPSGQGLGLPSGKEPLGLLP